MKQTVVTVSRSAPTLVWSGVGLIRLFAPGAFVTFGDSAVTYDASQVTNPAFLGAQWIRVASPDEIWAILHPTAGNTDVIVLELR